MELLIGQIKDYRKGNVINGSVTGFEAEKNNKKI